jgi:MFS family permease
MLRRLFPGVYEGWIVVGSAGVVMLINGTTFFYGLGTIFNDLIDEFGWSVAATSLAFSLRTEVQGAAAPAIGYAIDRVGARVVLLAGVTVAAIGLLALSFVQNIWQFYAVMLLSAAGIGAAGGQVGMTATTTWFRVRRTRALALMSVGGGLAGVLVVAIAVLVEALGWRGSLRVMAVFYFLVTALAASNVRSRPLGHPQPLDGIELAPGAAPLAAESAGMTPRQALRTRAFWLLAAGQAASFFSIVSVILLTIPYLESLGFSKGVASTGLAAFTLSSVVGRVGFGFIADRGDKRRMLALGTALAAAGTVLLALAEPAGSPLLVAMVGLMILGPGFGAMIPVRTALLADYYGTRHFGTINGSAAFVMTAGAVIGPWVVGRTVDATGSYTMGWAISAAVAALAVPFILAAHPPASPEAVGAGAPAELSADAPEEPVVAAAAAGAAPAERVP